MLNRSIWYFIPIAIAIAIAIAIGLPFLTKGRKSKGNPKEQAQRLRRVSPCLSYNNEKNNAADALTKNNEVFGYVDLKCFYCSTGVTLYLLLRLYEQGSMLLRSIYLANFLLKKTYFKSVVHDTSEFYNSYI